MCYRKPLHYICHAGFVRGVEVKCGLSGISQFCFAGLDQSREAVGQVGRAEVLDVSVLPARLVRDLNSRGGRRGRHLAHECPRYCSN